MAKTHKTNSHVTGSFLKFLAAVLRALPRDIPPDVADSWTKNIKALANVLRNALVPSDVQTASGPFPISVDYGRSVEDGVKAGRYTWVDPNITSCDFPTEQSGEAEVVVELVHLNRAVSNNEALRVLDRMGFRPAKLQELLAFGEKHPKVQREFQVIALGSVWQHRDGSHGAPYLNGDSLGRGLGIFLSEFGLGKAWWFAAVRK